MRATGITIRVALATLAILGLVSCGGSARSTTTTAGTSIAHTGAEAVAAAMQGRLRAHGYTVTVDDTKTSSQPYEQTFSVDNVDWTTPRAFNVAVYLFSSKGIVETQPHVGDSALTVNNARFLPAPRASPGVFSRLSLESLWNLPCFTRPGTG